jgi:hypothetical protein
MIIATCDLYFLFLLLELLTGGNFELELVIDATNATYHIMY